jgi:DNA polymerase-3 subunit epsilon
MATEGRPAMNWTEGHLLAIDTETTGPNPTTARIVTADVVHIDPSTTTLDVHGYLADPGVDIPAEATAVHGITTEHARTNGMVAADVVLLLLDDLESAWRGGWPVVAFNASYDLTVIDHELRRHHGRGLEIAGPVLDPFVIDKAVDRYRKGSRKLGDVCKHYGVKLDNAHNSAADAEAAGLLMLKMAEWYPGVREKTLRELWTAQREAYREQAASFEDYLRRKKRQDGESEDAIAAVVIERDWPLRPYTEQVPA